MAYSKRRIIEKDVFIKGTIKRLNKNCPKPSGWFSGIVRDETRGEISFSGTCKSLVSVGSMIKATANYVEQNGYEQYMAGDVELLLTTDRSLIHYISGPQFPGVGRYTAVKIVDLYGKDTLNMLEQHIDVVQKECKLSDKIAEILHKGVLNFSIENQLQKTFPHLHAVQINEIIQKKIGDRQFDKIKKLIMDNTYVLLDLLSSISYRMCDDVALFDCGYALNDIRRLRYVFAKAVRQFMQETGNTYVNFSSYLDCEIFYEKVKNLMGDFNLTPVQIQNWVAILSNNSQKTAILHVEAVGTEYHLYLRSFMLNERYIVQNLMQKGQRFASDDKLKKMIAKDRKWLSLFLNTQKKHINWVLNDEQEKALVTAVSYPVSIVSGGPGRGKTTWIREMIAMWKKLHAQSHVLCLAPTGRAVNRMKESTGYTEVETIARFVLANQKNEDKDTLKSVMGTDVFKVTEETLIIIDESSMLDVEEAAQLLRLCKDARLIFIGDKDQLPPVEPGAFFMQVLSSGVVPSMILTKNMRSNVKVLAENADRVLAGNPNILFDPMANDLPYYLYNCNDNSALKYAIRLYQDYMQNGATYSDILVMSPVNKGVAGVIELNQTFQNMLNPTNPSQVVMKVYDNAYKGNFIDARGWEIPNLQLNSQKVRIFDRVMNTKNKAAFPWKKYQHNIIGGTIVEQGCGIYNGDVGIIERYYEAVDNTESPKIVIRFDDDRVIFVPLEEMDTFVLGYCFTIHKAQGSEAEHVIIVLPERCGASWSDKLMTRNLLYTAVTRAKNDVVLVGSKYVYDKTVKTRSGNVNSMLSSYLQQYVKF